MFKARRTILLGIFLMLGVGICLGQYRRGGRRFWSGENNGPIIQTEGGEMVNEDTVRTARETAPHSFDLPPWTNTPAFEKDVFTFTRILFQSSSDRAPWLGWVNDYPDGDLNLSARLQQLTSMKVDPDGRVVKLSDPALFDYPLVFMSHPEHMELPNEDIITLRNYLLNGGALLTDDMWGDDDWQIFEDTMKRVLPGRSWTELPMSHPLFHCVF